MDGENCWSSLMTSHSNTGSEWKRDTYVSFTQPTVSHGIFYIERSWWCRTWTWFEFGDVVNAFCRSSYTLDANASCTLLLRKANRYYLAAPHLPLSNKVFYERWWIWRIPYFGPLSLASVHARQLDSQFQPEQLPAIVEHQQQHCLWLRMMRRLYW